MSRQSMARAHQKIQELSWEPLYHEPVSQYGTDYTFAQGPEEGPAQAGAPVLLPHAGEKDTVYERLQDSTIRGACFRPWRRRSLELAEAVPRHHPAPGDLGREGSTRCSSRTCPDPELQDGRAIAVMEQFRRSTISKLLKRLSMNNYIDPTRFNSSLPSSRTTTAAQSGASSPRKSSPSTRITAASIYLTIVAGTTSPTHCDSGPCQTTAAADERLPPKNIFRSVQSIITEHGHRLHDAADGLADKGDHQLPRARPQHVSWNNHRVVDAAIGTLIEYGTKDRRKDRETYAESGGGGSATTTTAATWCRWRSTAS